MILARIGTGKIWITELMWRFTVASFTCMTATSGPRFRRKQQQLIQDDEYDTIQKPYLLGLPWKRGYRCKSGRNRTEWPLHSQATGSGEIARLQNQDRLRRFTPVPRDGQKGASNVISLAFKWQQWMYWWRRELLLSLWFVGFAVLLCLGRSRSDVWRNSQVYFARKLSYRINVYFNLNATI